MASAVMLAVVVGRAVRSMPDGWAVTVTDESGSAAWTEEQASAQAPAKSTNFMRFAIR